MTRDLNLLFTGRRYKEHLDFWRERLLLTGETFRFRPSGDGKLAGQERKTVYEFCLEESAENTVRKLANNQDLGLFVVALSGFMYLLSKYASRDVISVRSPLLQKDKLTTIYADEVLLVQEIDDAKTVRDLLRDVQKTVSLSYKFQNFSITSIPEISQSKVNEGTNVFIKFPSIHQENGNNGNCDLLVELTRLKRNIQIRLTYNATAFTDEFIKSFAENYQRVLGVFDEIDTELKEIYPLIELNIAWHGKAEVERVEDESAGLRISQRLDQHAEHSIAALFEEQVERSPQSIAFIHNGHEISYQELNSRANQLGHYLIEKGVTPEAPVGVRMSRSIEMVVAILGVLKAGGAYVPLDPGYPERRLAYMVKDAQIKIVLNEQHTEGGLDGYGVEVVSLDERWGEISKRATSNPVRNITGYNLAYVIYTSGSTGEPKGVMGLHKGAINRFKWMWEAFPFDDSERCCQKTSFSFIDSVWEIFGGSLKGVPTVILGDDVAKDAAELVKELQRQEITRIVVVPSLLRAILQTGDGLKERLSNMKLWVSSGEALTEDLKQEFQQIMPEARLLNLYGSTEVTADATSYEIKEENRSEKIAIGRPILNTDIYILNGRMQMVPLWGKGELYIGGDGQARGYLGKPDMTAVRFLPNPFSEESGARLYRTGDIGRFRSGGVIEYLARADQQVKVRGYRIELGEIEAELKRIGRINQAVVTVREDGIKGKMLVGYVVEAEGEVRTSDLRKELRERLPDYMVPSVIVKLEQMPLNANGKIDRMSLPAPDQSRHASSLLYQQPRSPIEELLEAIWCDVLAVTSVGVTENFFDIGGHSLLATQVINRISSSVGADIPLRKIFEGPTIEDLARYVEQELRKADRVDAPQITKLPRAEGVSLPLSFAQQRLWFIDQLLPGNAAYNIPIALRIEGSLDESALKFSLDQIVSRHEALRTRFELAHGEPVQVIDPAHLIDLSCVDLTQLHHCDRDKLSLEIARQEATRGFDLSRGGLIRALIIRNTELQTALLICMHHIVSDGWSIGILMRELSALYRGYIKGEEVHLQQLEIQYADYALWQRQWLEAEVLDKQLDYWKQELHAVPTVLELPTDRARPPVQRFEGAYEAFRLEPEVSEGVKRLTREEGATLFMSLLAAFEVMLYRYSGQQQICIGTPIANRTRPEVEKLIGFFVNTLVMKADLTARPSFRDLLRRVKHSALGAYTHQDLPFERLVEELEPDRSLSHTPMFQVMFTFQNGTGRELGLDGVNISNFELKVLQAKFDITMSMRDTGEGIIGILEYRKDLYEEETIRRMTRHYKQVLEGAIANAEMVIDKIAMLSEKERAQILHQWNETARLYDTHISIVAMFERVTQATGQATAVVFDDQAITYDELNSRANKLAWYLMRAGVMAEQKVGLMMSRSIQMVVSILGILKAGAAYLPLDSSYPPQRVNYMVEDAAIALILTDSRFEAVLEATPAHILNLDELCNDISTYSGANPGVEIAADNLAYVIYTSGSTGEPKGVSISHRAVNRLVINTDFVHISSHDKIAQASTVSFDAATFEIWGALLNGAEVVIISREQVLEVQEFVNEIKLRAVSVIFVTTALFNEIAREVDAGLTGVRNVLFGGEMVDVRRVRELIHKGRPERLLHVYGPTESTTFTSWEQIQEVSEAARTVAIGRAIANTQVYVLDEEKEAVAIGVAGELYIGGDGLARGYLNRPELTAEKFIPNPFCKEAGHRLYRTGDICRWNADGKIDYIARSDNQVKVRGYRIELGEIEAALEKDARVKQAVVVMKQDAADKRLIGYVVMQEGVVLTSNELRTYLKNKLPDYMVPSVIVKLEQMPLNANGKIDRMSLPAPDQSRHASSLLYQQPRSPIEELLEAIWCDVLAVTSVGVTENFFDIGGHSLLATQVINRISSSVGADIPLRKIFEGPTIEDLARYVEQELRKADRVDAPQITKLPRAEGVSLPLSFAQQRLWFIDQLLPGNAAYNIPIALRIEGSLDESALKFSLDQIVSRHEALRTRFELAHGEPVQVIDPAHLIDLSCVDLTQLHHCDRDKLSLEIARQEATRGFDLSRGGLIRALIIRNTELQTALLICMHHIVSDGWSIGILMRELSALYRGYIKGEEVHLQQLEIQYADYALWQRQWLEAEVLDKQLDYWKQELHAVPTVLELPTDRARPPVQRFEGAYEAFRLEREVSEGVKRLTREEGATLFMSLLAAFEVLLFRYSGQQQICIGTGIANRIRPEVEKLIGFFVNTLVMKADLTARPSFRDLLRRVKHSALGAYTHQDLPFERLVEELEPDRTMSHTPIFQVMFTFQNRGKQQLQLNEVSITPFPIEMKISHFDLILFLASTETEIGGRIEYNTDLFDRETIERMTGHFQQLLKGIIKSPDKEVSLVKLLSKEEIGQIVEEWNETSSEYSHDRCAHEEFEQQAHNSADAVAVEFGDEEITYAELNRRSNQLARYLMAQGVGPEVIVAICMNRSVEMIVAMLAVMKSGGSYLPLEPSYPQERLTFIIRDAQVGIALTQEELRQKMSAADVKIICIQSEWEEISRYDGEQIAKQAQGENLAYVIYTSGSTGRAKGVEVSHRSLMNLVSWHRREFEVAEADRASQVASIGFDASVWEIWPYLTVGGTICLVEEGIREDSEKMVEWLRHKEVSVSFLPTPIAELVLKSKAERMGVEIDACGRRQAAPGRRRREELQDSE